jgi:hypothetical protein
MSYQVDWAPLARDEALRIVLARPDRAEVVRAMDVIGAVLAEEGPRAGESREGPFRILIERPLAVKFTVDTSEALVTIAQVWALRS